MNVWAHSAALAASAWLGALALAGCAGDDPSGSATTGLGTSATFGNFPTTSTGEDAGDANVGLDLDAGGEGGNGDASTSGDGGGLDAGDVGTTADASAGQDSGAGEGGASALASPGCGQSPPAGGDTAITVSGSQRRYVLVVPGGYDANRAYPLVFGFHGATTTAETFQSNFYGGLAGPVGNDAIVVYGQALGNPTAWEIQGTADLEYFDAVLAEVRASLCVDDARVFATGHSSGGYFSNRLGCERGDVLRAIAPLAGGGPFTFSGCRGQVAAWVEHGGEDPTVEVSQGEGSRDFWAAANGCGATTTATPPSPCVAYDGCDAGYPVHWCVTPDGDHSPRASLTGAGAWSFFQQF